MSDYSLILYSSFPFSYSDDFNMDYPIPYWGFNQDNEKPDSPNLNINLDERDTNEITNENLFKKKKKSIKKKKENIAGNLFIDLNESFNQSSDEKKDKKLLGRKRKDESDDRAKHNRFADDNSRRKVKRIIISELHDFINEKIYEKYDGDIGEGMNKKKLMKLCQDQISNAKIQFNKDFLNKSLEEIFSQKLSGRITNYDEERNKEIITELKNEQNAEISDYFKGLFNLTFKTCLEYFRDDEVRNIYLEGLKKFSDLKEDFQEKEGKDYTEHIEAYIKKYEIILNNKKPRKN